MNKEQLVKLLTGLIRYYEQARKIDYEGKENELSLDLANAAEIIKEHLCDEYGGHEDTISPRYLVSVFTQVVYTQYPTFLEVLTDE